MIIRIEDEALAEWQDAVLAYEGAQSGLGERFVHAVREGIKAITEDPRRWPAYAESTRAYRLDRFPFRIVYVRGRDEIVIVTIMHTKRDDDFWRRRFRKT